MLVLALLKRVLAKTALADMSKGTGSLVHAQKTC